VVLPNARRAAWFRAGVGRVGWRHAHDGGQPAEPIVAADRFAHKIVRFLTHALRCACGAELHRSAAAKHIASHYNIIWVAIGRVLLR